MRLLQNIHVTVCIILLSCTIVCQASTFKPFVRSRYSLRWRTTTDIPKLMDSTTTAPKIDAGGAVGDMQQTTSMQSPNSIPQNLMPAMSTLAQSEIKTSTHSPDYDYYGNNEVDENENKK